MTARIAAAIAAVLWLAAPAQATGPDLARLAWLAGCWNLVGGEPGSGEYWMPPAGGSLLGMSRTVVDGRTVFHEFMRIGPDANGRIAFHAQPSGQPPAAFPATRVGADEVVFEEPAHDFPQRIGYRFEPPATLRAYIEGRVDGRQRREDFHFVRGDCATMR
jgi:Domain of unknown function (DUF6265)